MQHMSRLASIQSFDELLHYLRDELGWPIDDMTVDDLAFDYDPAHDLGLPIEATARVTSLKQLRPLTSGQAWSVFYVEFERRYIPLRLLQRILRALTLRRGRGSATGSNKLWKSENLLFVSASGGAGRRRLDFLHFERGGKAATRDIRALGWDPAEPAEKLAWVEKQLHRGLTWPHEDELRSWPAKWTKTFLHRPVRERTAWADLDDTSRKALIELYTAADLTVDALPYTADFEWMADAFNLATGQNLSRYDFWRALSTARKGGNLPRKQRLTRE